MASTPVNYGAPVFLSGIDRRNSLYDGSWTSADEGTDSSVGTSLLLEDRELKGNPVLTHKETRWLSEFTLMESSRPLIKAVSEASDLGLRNAFPRAKS